MSSQTIRLTTDPLCWPCRQLPPPGAAAAPSPSSPCIPSSLSCTFPCPSTPASGKPNKTKMNVPLKQWIKAQAKIMIEEEVKESAYFLLFQAQAAPTLPNHLCELPFPFWVLRLEQCMLLREKEIVATPVGLGAARLSSPFSLPLACCLVRLVRDQCL